MIHLVCNHCRMQDDFLYCLGHASVTNGSIYENGYGEADIHLHWDCIPLWWAATEGKREAADEVPFR